MISEAMKICGLSEEAILHELAAFEGEGVEFEVEEDCLDARITMRSELDKKSFDSVKSRVYNIFAEQVYSAEDRELHELAAQLLRLNGRTLAVAESLTGGEICSRLTSVPGISENFYEGVVCYDRGAKMHRLRIPKALLGAYGAVSRETAYAMVKGLLDPPVDIGLATTGLAGPQGRRRQTRGACLHRGGRGRFHNRVREALLGGTQHHTPRNGEHGAVLSRALSARRYFATLKTHETGVKLRVSEDKTVKSATYRLKTRAVAS